MSVLRTRCVDAEPGRVRQLLHRRLHRGFFADPLAIRIVDRVQARRRRWGRMHAARNEACLCEGQWSLPSRTTADLNKPTAGHLCGRTSTPRTCPHGSSGTAPASFKGTTAMHAHGASLACTSAFAAAITTGPQTCGSKPVESSANRTRTASDARDHPRADNRSVRCTYYSLIQRSLSLPFTRSSATCSAVFPLGT